VQAAVWSPPVGTLGMLVADAHRRAAVLIPETAELAAAAATAAGAPRLAPALVNDYVAVIAEVKRRSPSKGSIKTGIKAAAQAEAYADGGAAAVSVLTEPTHFGGTNQDLIDVTYRVTIPVVKKDFHVHTVQLLEAKALGASAALLIVRALSPEDLRVMADTARELELETILEIRDEAELDRALAVGARIIGINNRNLETLEIDPATALRLLPLIPRDVVAIAESGMTTAKDVEAAAAAGADAVLIGSFVSASDEPVAAVRALSQIPRTGRNG
jgi:indole-3-glycerol phosphate synthase